MLLDRELRLIWIQMVLSVQFQSGRQIMQVCIGELHGKPVMLKLENGVPCLNDEAMPIKNLTEQELKAFQEEVDGLPKSDNPGCEALLNACRASFIANLLGKCVGDECVDKLTHVLDHVHYEVQKYLGEVEED
jgi:hypothetical protein